MGVDYYGILGINKDASEDELKKAYKKAAMKWHPGATAQRPAHARAVPALSDMPACFPSIDAACIAPISTTWSAMHDTCRRLHAPSGHFAR